MQAAHQSWVEDEADSGEDVAPLSIIRNTYTPRCRPLQRSLIPLYMYLPDVNLYCT